MALIFVRHQNWSGYVGRPVAYIHKYIVESMQFNMKGHMNISR